MQLRSASCEFVQIKREVAESRKTHNCSVGVNCRSDVRRGGDTCYSRASPSERASRTADKTVCQSVCLSVWRVCLLQVTEDLQQDGQVTFTRPLLTELGIPRTGGCKSRTSAAAFLRRRLSVCGAASRCVTAFPRRQKEKPQTNKPL